MPYNTSQDLPQDVQDALDGLEHAQEIYREAYNSAAKQYDQESQAHATAWAAVKEEYKKTNGEWKRKRND